ncbi:pyridoxal phosphate-dependent transferase [Hypoxylon rubiginosum]|uniref:Pyridoxal phosphate-dependent transferase n=1 Tax=Hypoxylon rubiginosum TaxID=110542 RepID=A0ACC0CLH1_9PEZI|nr:pyridoxal phosphate-dependent transferase [Hypoxylon rubiginosum]
MSANTNSAILHRSLEKEYPAASGGDGVYIRTADGRRIFDGSSGAAVSCLGHGNKEVIEAICSQARALAFAHSSFFTSDPAEELARFVMKRSNGAFSKVVWLGSGSEAVESALKIARQYHVFRGEPERVNFVGRLHSYHGNTLGALAAGNNPGRRKIYEPILSPAFHHVGRCFYDADGKGLSEEEYEDQRISEYEAEFLRLGPRTVAAVILEPVVGATLGSVLATKNYLSRLSELCRRHGILTIFDEVMCGMGRVGTYHAWQSLGNVPPDLQTVGKGLGAGYQPLSAVLVGKTVCDTFLGHSKGAQAFLSGHTFQGHSIACASALAVQKIIARDGLVANCQKMGEVLHTFLTTSLPSKFFENGGSLRGLGLFRTVDFGTLGDVCGGPLGKEVSQKAFDLGAAVYLCSPTVDAILICPPYIMTKVETKELAGTFVEAFKQVLASRSA